MVKKHHPLLIALAKANPKVQKHLLKTCDDSCIRLLTQISSNLITGNIHLKPNQRKRLSSFKHILRELRHRGTPISEKRKLLIKQKGGFLPFLLPIAASALGGLISQVFSK